MGATNVDVLTKLDEKMMRLVERTRGVLTGSNNKSWLDNPLSVSCHAGGLRAMGALVRWVRKQVRVIKCVRSSRGHVEKVMSR